MEMTVERWLSVDDVAAYLGVRRGTVYKWVERSGLPARKVGRLLKFKQSEIDAWVERRSVGAADLHLKAILEAVWRIGSYTENMDFVAFAKNDMAIDAVIRNLEVIGEAAGRVPEEIRAGSPEIEWRKIVALRNVLAHEYFGVHQKIVWDVIVDKLKPLEAACRKRLESLELS
jgi:excisionase family DNA binding protein